jgi:hypothetical protein
MAYDSTVDPKGNFFLKQIPLLPQLTVMSQLSFTSLFEAASWLTV